MQRFVEAAARNVALQSLLISPSFGYTAASLGHFRFHPNIQRLGFDLPVGIEPDVVDMFKQIIETCPKLKEVGIVASECTHNNAQPIFQAMYKIQHALKLDLTLSHFNHDALDLLCSFLHNFPHPVNLWMTCNLLLKQQKTESAWLSHLIGPAVKRLEIYSQRKEVLQEFMKSLNDKPQLRCLHIEPVELLEEYHIVVNCIPDLLYLQEFKMRCFFSWQFSDNQLSTFKTQVLSAMAKNVSIIDAYVSLMNHSSVTWTEEEQDPPIGITRRYPVAASVSNCTNFQRGSDAYFSKFA
jgi:hypothetical protein